MGIQPFQPRVWGSHKSDKKWIDYRFHLFSRPLESHFGRFLAFLANFWGFSVQQRGISTYLPRVWGGHKSDKNWYHTRIKSWVFGQPGYDMGTANTSSGNGLKMILGVRRF